MKQIFIIILLLPTLLYGQSWERTLLDGRGSSVLQNYDGGYTITGYTLIGDSEKVCLIKTNEYGDTLWTKAYGAINNHRGFSVQQITDGGYIITGAIYNNVSSDVYLIKTDEKGDTLWTKTYGINDENIGFQIQQTTDGGFIITGFTKDSSNYFIYLIKTDSEGNIVSTTEIPIRNPNKKLIRIVDLSGREIFKPRNNEPYIEIYDDGTTRKKMKLK